MSSFTVIVAATVFNLVVEHVSRRVLNDIIVVFPRQISCGFKVRVEINCNIVVLPMLWCCTCYHRRRPQVPRRRGPRFYVMVVANKSQRRWRLLTVAGWRINETLATTDASRRGWMPCRRTTDRRRPENPGRTLWLVLRYLLYTIWFYRKLVPSPTCTYEFNLFFMCMRFSRRPLLDRPWNIIVTAAYYFLF